MITDKNGEDSNMNAISPPNSEFVPEFVGRQKAVNIFHSLRTLREQKNVLYVEADGGLGKTWLLQVYIKHCKRQRRPWHTAPDGVDPLIDFFKLENRTVDGLRRSIVERIGSEHFHNFINTDKKMQKEKDKSRLAELRRDLEFWFFQEFKGALRAKRTYTALFFDTFEIVHNRRVGRWFIEEFLPHRSTIGCFIVFAGRPRDLILPLNVEKYKLEPFTHEEALEYFQKKWGIVPGDKETQVISICNGKPLLLDLVVHYARRLQGSLDELVEAQTEMFEGRLVARFSQPDPISEIIQVMAYLKRRYNQAIFDAHGGGEDIAYPNAEEQLVKLPFVKYRVVSYPAKVHELALHDEFQRMIAEQQSQDWLKLSDSLYQDVVKAWYEEQINEATGLEQYLLQAEQLAYILERDFQAGLELYKKYFEDIKINHLFDLNDMIWGEVATHLGNDEQAFSLIVDQANWLFEISRYSDAIFWFKKLTGPEFSNIGSPESYTRIRVRLGHSYLRLGDVDKAGETWESAFQQAIEKGNIKAQASFSYNLGHVRHRQGRWDEALKLYENAIQYAREARDPEIMGEANFVSARLRARQADLEKAVQELKNGLSLTETSFHGTIRHAQALAYAGDVHRYLDDPLASQSYYGQSWKYLQQIDGWYDWRSLVLAGMGAAYNRSGVLRREQGNNLEEDLADQIKSLDYFKQSLDIVRQYQTETYLHQIFDRMGDLFLEIARLEQVSKGTTLQQDILEFSKSAGQIILFEERSWQFRLRESESSFETLDTLGRAQRLFDLALLQSAKIGEPHYMFDSLSQAASVAQLRNRETDLDYYSRLAGTLHGLDDPQQEKLFLSYIDLLRTHNSFKKSPSISANRYGGYALAMLNGGVFGRYLLQQQLPVIRHNLLGMSKSNAETSCDQLSKTWKGNALLSEFIQGVMDQLLFLK